MTTRQSLLGGLLLAPLGLTGGLPTATAASMNFFNQCVLTPIAVYSGGSEFTAIGLTTRDSGRLYLYFFSADGERFVSDDFFVPANALQGVIWTDRNYGGFAGVEGSLLACLDSNENGRIEDSDGDVLAGNAFLIDLSTDDVAYIPTLSIDDDDLNERDPFRWQDNPVLGSSNGTLREVTARGGSSDRREIDMQYLVDGRSGGDDTLIYIWTNTDPGPVNQDARAFDGNGASINVGIRLPQFYINVVDVETVSGLPSDFLGDGFIRWTVPDDGSDERYAFAFSLVISPSFGAIQTVLGNY